MKTFMEKLEAKWAEGKHVCVGLDPVADKLPKDLQEWATQAGGRPGHYTANYLLAMLRVMKATKDIAVCYKLNWAFFLSRGHQGLLVLETLVKSIKEETDVPVILDCKVGDIGATNEHYAEVAFDVIGADAITIHPYLGWEANKPFLDRKDKGIFVLCMTSNAGAAEYQKMEVVLRPYSKTKLFNGDTEEDVTEDHLIISLLFRQVAEHTDDPETWNRNGNCGLVTGATYPKEIMQVRRIAQDLPLLIPGIGKQGGDLEASVKAAKHRFLINSSSGIIFADDPLAETLKLHAAIQQVLIKIG